MTSLRRLTSSLARSSRGRAIVVSLTTMVAFASISALAGHLHAETTRDSILTEGKKLYSQHDEELIIRHFFDDRREGFFLDVGAWMWKEASTTYYLESHLGWSGIAIDAQKSLAADYKKHRPRTQFFSYLITDHSGDTGTLYVAGPISSADESHLDIFKKHPERFPGAVMLETTPMKVRTITLNDLLERSGVDEIDFMSMDIEGSEPPALAGFDIERYRPELVCIEVSGKTQAAVAEYFAAHGYERIDEYLKHDYVNWYYTPKSSE